MKLEEGMYVRYISGFHHNESEKPIVLIGKILRADDYIQLDTFWPAGGVYPKKEFEKFIKDEPSHNIIDLIEDDDIAVIEYYVSKYRRRIVRRFECSLFKSKEAEIVIFDNKHCDWWYDKNKKEWQRAKGYNPKIKSILTREQFENMSYKVGE